MGVIHGEPNSRRKTPSQQNFFGLSPVSYIQKALLSLSMLPILVLLFVPSTLAVALNSSPASLLQPGSNVSSLLSSLNVVAPTKCASRSLHYRHNVRAIDCLNLFTFILATEDHAKQQTFTVPPGATSQTTAYSRRAGSCEIGVAFVAGTTVVVSSFDEIMRAALRIVGLCLLDNRPDSTHCTLYSLWQLFPGPHQMMRSKLMVNCVGGGGVAVDYLLIGVAGLAASFPGDQLSLNETSLDRDFGTWFEGLVDS